MTSSDASSLCRIEWRPSRWLLGSLGALMAAACLSLWWSSLPRPVCVAGGIAVLGYGGWLFWREAGRKPFELTWAGGDADWKLECAGRSESLRHVGAIVRGGIAVLNLSAADGRLRRVVWWPDTLDAKARRALRLASQAAQSPRAGKSDQAQ